MKRSRTIQNDANMFVKFTTSVNEILLFLFESRNR